MSEPPWWSDENFKHRKYMPTHEVIYWKGNVAGTVDDCDRAVVAVRSGLYEKINNFVLPAEQHELDSLEQMLALVYRQGKAAAKKEIRAMLGVVEPRP